MSSPPAGRTQFQHQHREDNHDDDYEDNYYENDDDDDDDAGTVAQGRRDAPGARQAPDGDAPPAAEDGGQVNLLINLTTK